MTDVLDLPVRALFATGVPTQRASTSGSSSAAALVHEAVFALAARELAALIQALPLERAAAALRDRDPIAALGGLLADAALAHTAAVSDDPFSVALLRGAQRKRELLSRAGGAWATGVVADHLGITRQGVDKRRQAGTLLGVRLPSGEWVYPVAQFGPDGVPLPGLADILGAFRGLSSPWMRLEHLLAPDPALSVRAIRGWEARGPAHATDRPDASPADTTPRSAVDALRADGPAALPAVIAAVEQAGDLDA